MKDQQQVSASQMASLFFVFMTGSSIINIPSPLIGYAKNGAPLSLLLSLSVGIILLACVLFLYRKFPQLTLIEYSRELVGKWITFLFAIPIISFQLHMASGIVLDIGLFMTSSMMRQTPLYIFNLFIFFVAALTVRSGIEKFTRMFTMLMITVLFFVSLTFVLAIPNYHLSFLTPVLPDGFKPVLLGAYFSYGFPYVELILFSMLLPYARRDENRLLKKDMFLALFLNGFFLIAVTISTIMTFGPMAGERVYSMFQVAKTIELYEVIQRTETVIGYSLILASYMKAVITIYILNLTVIHLFKIKETRILVFPLTLICFLFSMIQISLGQARWINTVSVIHPLWGTFAFVLPLLILTVIAAFKKKKQASH
jgi:spore germination protein KB